MWRTEKVGHCITENVRKQSVRITAVCVVMVRVTVIVFLLLYKFESVLPHCLVVSLHWLVGKHKSVKHNYKIQQCPTYFWYSLFFALLQALTIERRVELKEICGWRLWLTWCANMSLKCLIEAPGWESDMTQLATKCSQEHVFSFAANHFWIFASGRSSRTNRESWRACRHFGAPSGQKRRKRLSLKVLQLYTRT